MDPGEAFRVLGRLDRELWLVTARAGSRRGGLIATFVSSASIVPDAPRVVLGLGKRHHTRELVEASRAFALHLIEEEQIEWVWRFGIETGREVDKLAGLAFHPGASGSPILDQAPGYLDCRVEARMDTGDRTVYLAEVVEASLRRPGPYLGEGRLAELAPPAERKQLEALKARDAAADREAIRAWRKTLSS